MSQKYPVPKWDTGGVGREELTVDQGQGTYSISEMAGLFDVSRQTLIYYDKIGLFKPAIVTDEGYRRYLPTQIPTMRLICLLKGLGLDLKSIRDAVTSNDLDRIVARLGEQREDVRTQIQDLERQLRSIDERIAFCEDVSYWQGLCDRPVIKHYQARRVVFEPFGEVREFDRNVLHRTAGRAIARLDDVPSRGWGTMIPYSSLQTQEQLRDAGAFVVVPEGASTAGEGTIELPEGQYVCMSRWGMPYDTSGLQRVLGWMSARDFAPAGSAFDFCLLDATSYDEEHQEDFCCLQIPVEF